MNSKTRSDGSWAPITAVPVPEDCLCGIYFLRLSGEVQYVGQSGDIRTRVAAHRRASKRGGLAFDDAVYLAYKQDELDFWETYWICAIAAKRNYKPTSPLSLCTPLGNIYFKHAPTIAELLKKEGPCCLEGIARREQISPIMKMFPAFGKQGNKVNIRLELP